MFYMQDKMRESIHQDRRREAEHARLIASLKASRRDLRASRNRLFALTAAVRESARRPRTGLPPKTA